MSTCFICNKSEEGSPAKGCLFYHFHVLPVRTLHIRDIGGERKVQTLDAFEDYAVCAECAGRQLAGNRNALQAARPLLLRFGGIFLAGLLVLGINRFLLHGDRVFFLLGLAALACGVLGCFSALKESREKSRALAGMREEDALAEAAWDAFLEHAPKKHGDEDLSYIPVNERTLQRKNGDLMILYDLVPAIAVEAWKRIHGEAGE